VVEGRDTVYRKEDCDVAAEGRRIREERERPTDGRTESSLRVRIRDGMQGGLAATFGLVAILVSVAAMMVALWPCLGRRFVRYALR
jgi:hypothetical protein